MDVGRGEERVRCMKRVTRKLTLPFVKSIANGNLQCGSGNSKQELCINLEGWEREGWERGSKGREYMYTYG